MDDVETGRMSLARDKSGGGLIAVRMTSGMQGGVTLHLALAQNVGTCRPDAKEKSKREVPARMRVPKRGTGAEQPVVGSKVR
jgi:galactokinase